MDADERQEVYKCIESYLNALATTEEYFKKNPSAVLRDKIKERLLAMQIYCDSIQQDNKFDDELKNLAKSLKQRMQNTIEFMDKIV